MTFSIVLVLFVLFVIAAAKARHHPWSAPPTTEQRNVQSLILQELYNGIIPKRYKLEGYLPKKGETVLWSFPKVKYYHETPHSQWVGGSAGFSVRVFKGFWLRQGALRGHRVVVKSMDFKGSGTLVLTDQAFVFFGRETVRIPLSRVMNVQEYCHGIALLTDYLKNSHYSFYGMHSTDITFTRDALAAISGTLSEERAQLIKNGDALEEQAKGARDKRRKTMVVLFGVVLVVIFVSGIVKPKWQTVQNNAQIESVTPNASATTTEVNAVVPPVATPTHTNSPIATPSEVRDSNRQASSTRRTETVLEDKSANEDLNRAWRALTAKQRNALRQDERNWIKHNNSLPLERRNEDTRERAKYLWSLVGQH